MLIIFVLIFIPVITLLLAVSEKTDASYMPLWSFQAVDTMKFSRDLSREKRNDARFDITINDQVKAIAEMGATHVGIATPYDEEFVPILKRWVSASRRHNLKVWFRGNWSGWEGWFDYPKIDRATHLSKTREFIIEHPELFEDGDVFSACPECENGGPGDPRHNGDAAGHRKFLIDEYKATSNAFKQIGKNVDTRYNSMNGDVARLIMDRNTTKALGDIVVVDHYVRTPDQLAGDIQGLADFSGGEVVLGEFGAPILDIHGEMTEEEQAKWLKQAMEKLVSVHPLLGMSYWVNVGGSTSLFNDNGTARAAVSVLSSFYNPHKLEIVITDPLGGKIKNATVQTLNRRYGTSDRVTVPVVEDEQRAVVSADGYESQHATLSTKADSLTVVMEPQEQSLLYKIKKLLRFLFSI